MPETMEEVTGLGIRKPGRGTMDSIPPSEREKTDRHLEMIRGGTERIRKQESEKVPGSVGYIGSIKWERLPVSEASFCAKCGDLLGSQYGVVEYGSEDGPYYCTPDHLREAKGMGI